MPLCVEDHAKSVMHAWVLFANERAKDESVKMMDFEHTPMNLALLKNLERLVEDTKNELNPKVYEELQIILRIHQDDFLKQSSEPNSLFTKPKSPVSVYNYALRTRSTHQDPNF